VKIRTYGPGDDAVQVHIYNEAAALLPHFKPAKIDEVSRRNSDPLCPADARFLAVVDDKPVAYATYQLNGRVSYPWCRRGQEALAEPLFAHVLQQMRDRGLRRAWAAYRGDWVVQLEFLRKQGLQPKREMINYLLDMVEMPTIPTTRPSSGISPLHPEEVPAVWALGLGLIRAAAPADLARHLLHNPYFPADAVFAMRKQAGNAPLGVGVIIINSAYADPHDLDGAMPCFRLGAFGTEGLTAKRINGLFSFVAADTPDFQRIGLDLLAHAAYRMEGSDGGTFAAQAPSDALYIQRFYDRYFRRQGSFPILERDI
jgi:hypothetical protein